MFTPSPPWAKRGLKLAGVLIVALAGCLIGEPQATAQNINWVGGTSTDWNTAANWDLDVVPTSSNNITLDTNSGNQPVISTGSTGGNIIVVGNTTASGANTLLTISGGAQFLSGNFFVGNTTGSTGSVLVTGAGTVLTTPEPPGNGTIPSTIRVGGNGTGSLSIANGAIVHGLSVVGYSTGGNGTVLVTGDGSIWDPGRELYAGFSGTSNITLANGGVINSTMYPLIDLFISGNHSQFTVTGQAASGNHSTFNSAFTVEITGNNNNLTVSHGGQIITERMFLSGNATTILVTDPGSEMVSVFPGTPALTEGFYLGFSNGDNAQLTIANGANLTTNSNYIGYAANTTGGVTITGPGSVWNATGNIVVGNATNSTASLTLANGGSINITSGNIILGQSGGSGILNLNTGAFFQDGNANGSLVFGNNSTINWNGGTMQATSDLNIPSNMTISGAGCTFDSNGYDSGFFGNISGIGNLTKNGNGNLTLTDSSNGNGIVNSSIQLYTGNVVINAGALILTHNSRAPGNVSANIADNASLTYSHFGSSGYFNGVLSGNGTFNVIGDVVLTSASSFTGNIQLGPPPGLLPGNLTFSGDTSQMSGNLIINQNSLEPVDFTQNLDTTYAGNITGSDVAIEKTGTGNLTLSGNITSTYAINAIPFQVKSGNLTFTGNISQFQGYLTLFNGANVVFSQSSDSNWDLVRGSGNIIQASAGTLTISELQLDGSIIINSGTVLLDDGAFSQTGNIVNNSALVFAAPFDDACPAIISGTGILTINVGGNLTLTGNSTYTGATTINSGTLLIDGQLAATSNVQVNSGGALGGNGTVLGAVRVSAGGGLIPGDNGNTLPDGNDDGGLAPGNGGILTFLGTLSVNALSLDPAATMTFDLTDPGNYSNLSVTGGLAETGNVVITLNSGFQPGTYQLISSTGGLSNDFSNITITGVYSPTLTDSGGVWTGSTEGVNFAFHAATGQLVVNYTIVPLSPTSNTTFSLTDPGNVTPLSVNGTLAEAGNLVLNLSANLHAGTYQLFTSNGGFSNDFANVTLTGLFSAALTDNGGVWSGNISGATFTFNAATGQLVISTPLLAGISASKAAWLQQNFTVPQLLDATISGDNASPAGDGISNYMKYALNLNPLVDGHAGLPQVSTDGTNLIFTYTTYQPDVLYNVQASTDLVNWSSDNVFVNVNGDLVTATYPLPSSGTAFMQLVVSPIDASPDITSAGYSDTLSNLSPAAENQILESAAASWAQQNPEGFSQGAAGIGARGQPPTGTGGNTISTAGGRRGSPPSSTPSVP